MPLVFGNLTVGQPAVLIGDPTPAAAGLSEQMQHAWKAFATDGDPAWPAYDTGLTRLFDIEPRVTALSGAPVTPDLDCCPRNAGSGR